MPQLATLARLAEIAQDQWGLITRRQAEAAGIPPATLARLAADPSGLDRVAHAVYRVGVAPVPDHVELRAAWLQLAPEVPAWRRTAAAGVVSHRSAASLLGLGQLAADRHEFTVAVRRQTRRDDVRLHRRELATTDWATLGGLPVTHAPRIAADLLADDEDPSAVAAIVADALRRGLERPEAFSDALAVHALRFGLRRGDGLALLRWFLDLAGDPDAVRWLRNATERRMVHALAVVGSDG